jgi:hypothetical protein
LDISEYVFNDNDTSYTLTGQPPLFAQFMVVSVEVSGTNTTETIKTDNYSLTMEAVTPNTAPKIKFQTPSIQNIWMVDGVGTLDVNVVATDVDDDEISLTWYATGGQVVDANLAATQVTYALPGTYTVFAKADDGSVWDAASVQVTIVAEGDEMLEAFYEFEVPGIALDTAPKSVMPLLNGDFSQGADFSDDWTMSGSAQTEGWANLGGAGQGIAFAAWVADSGAVAQDVVVAGGQTYAFSCMTSHTKVTTMADANGQAVMKVEFYDAGDVLIETQELDISAAIVPDATVHTMTGTSPAGAAKASVIVEVVMKADTETLKVDNVVYCSQHCGSPAGVDHPAVPYTADANVPPPAIVNGALVISDVNQAAMVVDSGDPAYDPTNEPNVPPVANWADMQKTNQVTFSAWVKIAEWKPGTYNTILQNSHGYGFMQNGGSDNLLARVGVWGKSINRPELKEQSARGGDGVIRYSTPQWVHIALTYDGSTVTSYVDGELQKSLSRNWYTNNFPVSGAPLMIGPGGFRDTGWIGEIDNVRVNKIALTADMVKAMYEGDL